MSEKTMICENAERCANDGCCPHKEKHVERFSCSMTAQVIDRPGCIQGSCCVEYVEKPETKALIFNPCSNCQGQANVLLWVDMDGRWNGFVECNACHANTVTHSRTQKHRNELFDALEYVWNANNPLPAPAKCWKCGAEARHIDEESLEPYSHMHGCKNPHCNQRGPRCKTEGESLASWNKQQGQAQ